MECDGPVPNPLPTSRHAPRKRVFIAHRGVNMRSTVAGENSLEAIRLAGGGIRRHRDRRAAFGRRGAGGHARQHAQPHLPACRRTVVGTGRSRRQDAPRAAVGLHLKAADPARRTRIPTLEESGRGARNGPYTFIEPKLYDPTGRHWREKNAGADAALRTDRLLARILSPAARAPRWDAPRRHLQQPRERRHPPHRHRRRAADGHSLPDHVRTDRGAGQRHRGRQRHPLRRSGLLPSGRTGQGSGADVRIARRQVHAFRPDQPPRHRFRLDRFPGARLPRAGPAARRVRTGRRVRAPRIGRRGRDPPRRGGRASSRNGSCPPYPSAPSTWKWKPKAAPASSWAAKPSRSTSPTSAPSRTRCCSTTPHLPCASRRSPEGSPSRRYGRRS